MYYTNAQSAVKPSREGILFDIFSFLLNQKDHTTVRRGKQQLLLLLLLSLQPHASRSERVNIEYTDQISDKCFSDKSKFRTAESGPAKTKRSQVRRMELIEFQKKRQ